MARGFCGPGWKSFRVVSRLPQWRASDKFQYGFKAKRAEECAGVGPEDVFDGSGDRIYEVGELRGA